MIYKILFSTLLVHLSLNIAAQTYPSQNLSRCLELFDEQPSDHSDSLVRIFMYSLYGSVLAQQKFEKTDSGHFSTTEYWFIENKEDLIVFRYKLSTDEWKGIFELLNSDFLNLDSIKSKKEDEFFRLVELKTPTQKKLVQRPNDFEKGKFKAKWWGLRILGVTAVMFHWTIQDEEGNPIKNAFIDQSWTEHTFKTDKKGVFELNSAIEFFNKSKHSAWVKTDEHKHQRVNIDFSTFERSKEVPHAVIDKRVIVLKK